MRPETIRVLEKNIGKKLLDIGIGGDIFECDTENTHKKSKKK